MGTRSLFNFFQKSPSAGRRAGRHPRAGRPTVESLEGRQLLTSWANTGGVLSSIVAGHSEVFGLDSTGKMWSRRDGSGWTDTKGYGVSIKVGTDSANRDEVWLRTSTNQVWRYDAGSWSNTGGVLSSITAGHGEVFGLGSTGKMCYYKDGSGWVNTNGYGSSIVVGTDSANHDEVWLRTSTGQIWLYYDVLSQKSG
jgi:Tectonin domain